jgi:glycosyltransferase involved in cell wall biosynthesis
MQDSSPLVSVIIPYYNASETLGRAMEALQASTYSNFEIITIDDRSFDGSSDLVLDTPGIHLSMIHQSGAAKARNQGVAASSGEILFFVDADVTVAPETIGELVRTFDRHPDIDACFGEYTPMPHGKNFATVYKNLVHHFTHQTANEQAHTFWCGCGAVRREAFFDVSGFDESFIAASVEDIDLGYRLHGKGHVILLNKKLQVTHGKQYTLGSLIRSDFFSRAIPWTKLMVSRNIFVPDLNLKWHNILSGIMLFAAPPLIYAAGTSFGWKRIWWSPLILVIAYIILNRKIFGFVIRQKGFLFSIPFFLMFTATYVYSSIGFAIGLLAYFKDRLFK